LTSITYFSTRFSAYRKSLGCGLALAAFVFMSPQAFAECYTYDDLGRLVNVVYDNVDKAQSAYSLDKHGNRITVSTTGSSSASCIPPSGTTSDYEDGPVISGEGSSNASGNQTPIADNETISMLINSTQIVMPLEGDVDPDGDTLSLVSISEASTLITATMAGNAVTVQSFSNEGSATITYMVSDGQGGISQGVISVTITIPNLPPDINICIVNGEPQICDFQ